MNATNKRGASYRLGEPGGAVNAASAPANVGTEITRRSGPIYRLHVREDVGGWWFVTEQIHEYTPQVIARVFGQKRAEIVRDALSAEANEIV